jgi:hypothetical protein
MYKLIAMTSIITLGFAGSIFAQANMGMDSSGRFDGSAPLGTSRADESPSGGFAIPFDAFETGSTTNTPKSIQWTCPPNQRHTRTTNPACVDNR